MEPSWGLGTGIGGEDWGLLRREDEKKMVSWEPQREGKMAGWQSGDLDVSPCLCRGR